MAFMLPEQVESFKTEGEGRFYRFLATVAKPDHSYLAWYTPDLQGKEPDFILYSDSVGLIIFEVKDWALHQIREANPHQFTLDINGVATARKNPLQQARDYIGDLKDKIKADGRLVSNDPAHHGNPRIPINLAVVFPNISKFEYTEKNLHARHPDGKGLLRDDLHPASDMCCDPSGQCFLKALNERFPPVFRFPAFPSDCPSPQAADIPGGADRAAEQGRGCGLHRPGCAPEDPGPQPGGPGAAVRRRPPDHRRPLGERQDAGAGPQGRLSAALQPGHQEHPVRLLQHHPGELRQTDPGRQGRPDRRRRCDRLPLLRAVRLDHSSKASLREGGARILRDGDPGGALKARVLRQRSTMPSWWTRGRISRRRCSRWSPAC